MNDEDENLEYEDSETLNKRTKVPIKATPLVFSTLTILLMRHHENVPRRLTVSCSTG